MDSCIDFGLPAHNQVRILIRRPCRGYYIRWWYNGWHYWYFLTGRIMYNTDGQEYRRIATDWIEISSGQIPESLVNGIKTISWSRSIYLLNENGWANVMIQPSRNIIKNNYIDGYELFFTMKIGTASVARAGYTPPDSQYISYTPMFGYTPSLVFYADTNNLDFIFSEYGISYARSVNILSPSPSYTMNLYSLDWAMVINSISKITVYPLTQNTGSSRSGIIELLLPGYSPIYIIVTQFQYLVSQVFESDKTYMDFIWDYYGIGVANYATLNVAPDQIITYTASESWIAVSINQTSNVVTIYPTGKNDSIQRSGTVSLHCPDAPDIDISVVQFAIPIPDAPTATAGSVITPSSFRANWNVSSVADGYYLDVAEDAVFTVPVAGFNNLDVGGVLTKLVSGLDAVTDYYYRVRAYNDSGTSGNSNTIKVTTLNYTISLDINEIYFSWDQVCCFGCEITVTSSHNWTAAWVVDDGHFAATSYAGNSGDSTIISTVGNNGTAGDWVQTLRFTCGTVTVDCEIRQYRNGWNCPI